MIAHRLILLVLSLIVVGPASVWGQNVWLDYHVNRPRHYAPTDPWTFGCVMRHQTGHSGWFYNCDCEEQKRFSPYIEWNRQACVECNNGLCATIHQQVDEVRQRVRTGSCKQTCFCLSPECHVCDDYHPPVCRWPMSPDPCAAALSPRTDPTLDYHAPPNDAEPPAAEPAPAFDVPSEPTSWMLDLYRN